MGSLIPKVALAVSACALHAQVAVLTANYDTDRTNSNLQESILNTQNVTGGGFGKLGSWAVDGQIYAQPLYWNGVVYVATMRNTVYAFDAAAGPGSAPLWRVNLGAPVPSSFLQFGDVNPEVGILSTPVIDPGQNTIYVVTETFENGSAVFRLHALDLGNGQEKMNGPVEIHAEVPGDGDGSQDGKVALDPNQHLQRPGLLLANHTVYAAFGSHADATPYHGWIVAYDAGDLRRRVAVLNTTPNGSGGSIWQSGRGLAADEAGNVLAGCANGDYDGISSFSETYLKLAPDLTVLDWYAPAEWQTLNDGDYDLGSLGPVRLAGTGLMLGGDKNGALYVIDEGNMGRAADGGNSPARVFRPISWGGIFNVALWNSPEGPIVYVVQEGAATRAFRIVDGRMEGTPLSETGVTADIPYQGMAVSTNGGEAGTAILWMTTGDHDTAGVPGTLHAFDALDLTRELWSSEANPDRDAPGRFAKFVSPTVADGRVYVPTFSGQLAVYGLLPVSD